VGDDAWDAREEVAGEFALALLTAAGIPFGWVRWARLLHGRFSAVVS
jgi:hypothetical protein